MIVPVHIMDIMDQVNQTAYAQAYTQAFETMRYYGNLRFTALTAFIIITGGLFTIALRNTKLVSEFWFPSVAGVVIALAFGLVEWRIANNFEFYGEKTEIIGKHLRFDSEVTSRPPNSEDWRLAVRVILESVYGGSILMWIAVGFVIRKRGRAAQLAPSMKYYSVAEIDIIDKAWVAAYIKNVTHLVEKRGGRYLARTSNIEKIEGERQPPQTFLIIEWPSKDAALAFYESDEYGPYLKSRLEGARSEFVLVAGEDAAKTAKIPG